MNTNTQGKLDFSYKSLTSFTNRDEYKAFRRAWKADYLQAIADIRKLKLELKEDQRKDPASGHWKIYHALIVKRGDIREMISDKAAAATEACVQYLALKEALHG